MNDKKSNIIWKVCSLITLNYLPIWNDYGKRYWIDSQLTWKVLQLKETEKCCLKKKKKTANKKIYLCWNLHVALTRTLKQVTSLRLLVFNWKGRFFHPCQLPPRVQMEKQWGLSSSSLLNKTEQLKPASTNKSIAIS